MPPDSQMHLMYLTSEMWQNVNVMHAIKAQTVIFATLQSNNIIWGPFSKFLRRFCTVDNEIYSGLNSE
jgi:hypothetical protein